MFSKLAAVSALAIGLVAGRVAAQTESGSQASPGSRAAGPAGEGNQVQSNDQGSHGSQGTPSAREPQESQRQAGQEGALSQADRRFIEAAVRSNDDEIRLAELARSKGQTDDVKRLAERIIDDSREANDQLKALAQKKGITPVAPPCTGEQPADSRLSKLPSDRFDRAYLSEVMQHHLKDVAEFQRAGRDANDPEVKQFAQETLPVLQEHEHLVNDIRNDMSAPANGGSQNTKGAPATQGGPQGTQGPPGSQGTQGNSQGTQGGPSPAQRSGAQSPQGNSPTPSGAAQGGGKAPPPPSGSPTGGTGR